MSAKDCPHESFAWDSWYHCMACEEQRQQQEKDAEWNAAIEAAAEVVSQHFSQSNPETVALRIRALIRKVKP